MKQKKNSNTLVYYKVIYSCEYSIKLILKCYVKNCLPIFLYSMKHKLSFFLAI